MCWGKMYPVVNGRLRRHPGLSDPIAMSDDYEGIGRRYGVLLVWLVEAEDGGTLRKCRRRFEEGIDDCAEIGPLALVPLILSQMMVSFYIASADPRSDCSDPKPEGQMCPDPSWLGCLARQSSR